MPVLKQQMGVVLLPAAAVPGLGEQAVELVGVPPEPAGGRTLAGLPRSVSGTLGLRHGIADFQEVPEPVVVALDLVKQGLPYALPQGKLNAVQLVVPGDAEPLECFLEASRELGRLSKNEQDYVSEMGGGCVDYRHGTTRLTFVCSILSRNCSASIVISFFSSPIVLFMSSMVPRNTSWESRRWSRS